MLTATMVLAGSAAGLAVVLLVAPTLRLPRAGPRTPPRWLLPASVALVAGPLLATSPRTGVLAAIAGATMAAALALRQRRVRGRAAVDAAGRVLETCDALAAELAAGLPPGRALRRAATAWPDLRPVAETHALGGDVPDALRALAAAPGAHDLRLLAAAWAVAHRTGHGLADAIGACAESLRAAGATRRVVEGELASARATARLVAALPVLALLMGSGAGSDPIGFLLGHPVGLACLAGGLAFGLAGLWWIERIADDVVGGW